jgi:S1-C subfamily serine protease
MTANELYDGVEVTPLDDENAEQYRIPSGVTGLLITAIDPESPYARRLQEGMVIVEVNDDDVASVRGARDRLSPGINKLYIYHRGRTVFIAIRVD